QGEASSTFEPPPPITSLTEGLRVLTRSIQTETETPQGCAVARDPPAPNTSQTIFIGCATTQNGDGENMAGASLWYGPENEKNMVLRVPVDQLQTSRSADICATLLAIQRAPRDQALKIVSSKNSSRIAMTRNLGTLEDKGWVGVANRDSLKALAAELRSRTAATIFVDVSPESPEILRNGERTARLQA
ncbi:hypothetical protein B0H16DRAFT_1817076, partial [Mycena metata]